MRQVEGADLDGVPCGRITWENYLEIWRAVSGLHTLAQAGCIRSLLRHNLDNSDPSTSVYITAMLFLCEVGDAEGWQASDVGEAAFHTIGKLSTNDNRCQNLFYHLRPQDAISIVDSVRGSRWNFQDSKRRHTHDSLTDLVERIYQRACRRHTAQIHPDTIGMWEEPRADVRQSVLRLCVNDRHASRKRWMSMIEEKPLDDTTELMAEIVAEVAFGSLDEAQVHQDPRPLLPSEWRLLLNDASLRARLLNLLGTSGSSLESRYWLKVLDKMVHMQDHIPLHLRAQTLAADST